MLIGNTRAPSNVSSADPGLQYVFTLMAIEICTMVLPNLFEHHLLENSCSNHLPECTGHVPKLIGSMMSFENVSGHISYYPTLQHNSSKLMTSFSMRTSHIKRALPQCYEEITGQYMGYAPLRKVMEN